MMDFGMVFPAPAWLAADPAAARVYEELVPAVVGNVVVYIVLWAAMKAVLPKHQDAWNIADLVYTLPFYSYLSYLSITATMECVWTVEGRWWLYTQEMRDFFILYISRSIVHIPVLLLIRQSWKNCLEMFFHHFISCVCFFGGIYTRTHSCWAMLDGLCEISSFFLCVVMLIKALKWEDHCTGILMFSGISLWLAYLFFRLALFPYWLYQYAADMHADPSLWEQSNAIQRYVYPLTNLTLFALSCMWMVPITRGLVKQTKLVLRGKKKHE